MAHHQTPDDIIAHNQTELDELAWSIEMSLGQFRIYFARCNYIRLRSRLIQQLQALTSVEIRVVKIKASERTLYARIQAELGDEKPDAAMVLGLEAVENSRQLLSATNQVREEFRKHFSFPLVLWVNDQGFKDFLMYAPDFQSWGITSHFLMPRDELIAVLRENVEAFFAGKLQLSLDHCREIHQATQDLPEAEYQGSPELAATVETLRGVVQAGHPVNRNLDQGLIHYQNSAALWQDCEQVERQGKLLQELAIGYSLKAASIEDIQHPDWQAARQYVQQCLAVFAAAQRPDLVANSLSSLAGILRRLGEWQELQQWAEQAIAYHKQANLSNQLAQDYGILAQVALAEADWQKAQDLAQQALDCLAVSSGETDKPWQMAYAESQYRFTLAQAYSGLNQPQAAIENLERAQTVGSPEYDTALYLDILGQLQQGYFQQRQYVQAFEIKLRRQSIEQQYGLRAFVGAAWIQPQREAKLAPTAASPAYSQSGVGEMIAPEIAASGRQLDVERLIERIGRHDCKLIVIHGQSGVGKSSLVQGGLMPALKQKVMGTSDTLPITMRVYSHWQEELARLLAEALADNGVETLPDGVETFHGTSLQVTSLLGQTERLNLRTVLIFDQFEEFFFVYPDASARRRFFQFIGECLKISPVKVVLSLREDYLHYLLECNYLDSMKVIGNDILSRNILYRLGNFSAADTQSIIQRLTERSSFHLEAALIEALVQDLAGDVGEVRPIELQVVGAQLQTEKITRLAEYRQYGEQAKEVLVRRYLDEVVADCGEENRQAAELVLYLLTDEKGTRPLKTRGEIERDLQALAVTVTAEGVTPERRGEGMVGIAHPTTGASLDLVLQIFVKSGLVLLLPENPEQRYQLVHDYLAAFIRQQQEPRLQELIAELENERKQRRQAEAQRQLTEAELERTEQARQRLNRQVRRALAGLALTGVMAGVIVLSLGGWATKTVGDAKSEVSAAEDKIEQAETKRKQAETQVNQAKTQVAQAKTQLGTVQTQFKNAQTKTQAAEAKQKEAEAKRQAAQKQVQQAQRQMQAANQNLKTAQAKVNQAQQQYETANQAAETARKNAEAARREQAQLQEQVQLAETALQEAEVAQQAAKTAQEAAQIAQKEAQEGTRLEREGTNAIKEFEYQPLNALISAMEAGQDLQKIVKNRPLKDYPATSPLLALQTILDNIQERVQLNGHQGYVTSANFSPDGERIVTASDDKTARVWDIQGNLLTELIGYYPYDYDFGSPIFSSANFSPDGQHVVTASDDKTAWVWDRQGNLLTKLIGHQSSARSANFSPDGQHVVTASDDKTARVWDRQGNLLSELKGHQDDVNSANFSPDGQHIVTASDDNTARVWDRQGNLLSELKGHQDDVNSANFSPDGQRIVTASSDKTARVWDRQGNLLSELIGHQSGVNSANFSPDGQGIVTASWDNTARVWDRQGNLLSELIGHQSGVNSANFSPDGQGIVTASWDNTARVWDRQGNSRTQLIEHQSGVNSANFSPDGQHIVTTSLDITTSWDNTARVWDRQGNLLSELKGHQNAVRSANFSPDGLYIVTASSDKTARVWDRQGNLLSELKGHQSDVYSANFSPDGERIVTASSDKTARVWDRQGNLLSELKGHQSDVYSANFSPDGQHIVTASSDKTARVWDRQGNLLSELKGHQSDVYSANFSPDGQHIVTASWDNTARVWDRQGNLLTELKGHQDIVFSANFSPDGQRIVTASRDKTARVWDRQGNLLSELKGHQNGVLSANFSPNGQQIVTASSDKTARVWRADGLDSLLARGCDWLNQHLILNPQDLEKLEVCQTPANKTAAARFWVYQGETQARQGNIEQAVELFRKALAWNPNLNLNPERKAQQIAEASEFINQGERAAKVGNVDDAVTAFNRALQLDSSLNIKPKVHANKLAAFALVYQGEGEAVTVAFALVYQGESAALLGDYDYIDAAITAFNRAMEIEPSLKIRPNTYAKGIAAFALVSVGEEAAREGNIDAAITAFNRAIEIDPSLNFKPQSKVAFIVVEQGQKLADEGKIKQAIENYQQAQTLDPEIKIPAEYWYEICLFGSLNDDAQDILSSCEKAVELASENDRPKHQDSRGVARALTGNIQGAIADFQTYIDWLNTEQQKYQSTSLIDFPKDILAERRQSRAYLQRIKAKRQGWIEALKDGENPFTPEELESLRNE